jgi:hypothetical protein
MQDSDKLCSTARELLSGRYQIRIVGTSRQCVRPTVFRCERHGATMTHAREEYSAERGHGTYVIADIRG